MGRRHIFIVRHGQADPTARPGDGLGGGLTDLGRTQAQMVGRRLASQRVDIIHHSVLHRAAETAQIIRQQLPHAVPLQPSDLLREVIPYIPPDFITWYLANEQALAQNAIQPPQEYIPWIDTWPHSTSLQELERGFAQANRAYETFFCPSPDLDRVDVLVCHGNILRYFVVRALQAPLEAWINTDINNCGISEVVIEENGSAILLAHNSTGHMPADILTFV